MIFFACKKEYDRVPAIKITAISSPVTDDINSMAFPKSNLAFAACEDGHLLKSTDNGNTWKIDSTFNPANRSLKKIMFPDSLTGFILLEANFSTNQILKTTNGGLTWSGNITGNYDPIDFSFPTAMTGYILTSTYQYKTTNGGTFWNTMPYPVGTSFSPDLISFANRDTGFVKDFDNKLFRTLDAGNSWSQVYSGVGASRQIKFKSSRIGYSVDGGGNIFTTSNNGVTWTSAFESTSETEFELYSTDWYENTAVAVGNLSVVVSKNSGQTWEYKRNQDGITIQTTIKDVHLISASTAIACGIGGHFYRIEL
jgi:hypothetical protein